MLRLVGFFLAISCGSAAFGFQKFEDYRILGSEIASIKAIDPEFEEDPEVLEIELVEGGVTLQLETDGFLDECLQSLEYLVGDPNQYAQIVVQVNTPTMNGSLIVQCTAVGLR
ncbi:hypothetical protein [Planktotalea sp.]|uniref:hypothetical protein n=1 Tax=Planktotalea sp. TaxID=2029877 RepID=UPI003D6C04F3